MSAKKKSTEDNETEAMDLSEEEVSEDQTSYDLVPYNSHPFPQSHPDRLACMARLFGLTPPDINECRVLELGCAAGGNIIPMAVQLPDSRFTGVDLSKKQIDSGQKVVDALSLKNMELKHASILDVDGDWGEFDYIICHGVFSWVPEAVQEKIFSIYSKNLSADGVGYISYNTYPGWHMRGMIRHMMNYHVAQFEQPEVRIRQSRALLKFMSDSVPPSGNPHGMVLKRELDLLARQADSYLFHEHLEDDNRPLYFHEFADWADRHELQYLSEADFGSMLARGFGEQTRQTLDRISTDIVRKEQYMDFLRNRPFRQTLLVKKDREINRNVDAEAVTLFRVTISSQPQTADLKFAPGAKLEVRTRYGGSLHVTRPITKAALAVLDAQRPASLEFEDLFQRALDRLPDPVRPNADAVPTARNNLASDLLQCFTARLVDLVTWDPTMTTQPSDHPKCNPLVAHQAGEGNRVVGARHQYLPIGPVAKVLAPVLDGTRDHKALAGHLKSAMDKGELKLQGQPDPAQLVEQALGNLARLGVLIE